MPWVLLSAAHLDEPLPAALVKAYMSFPPKWQKFWWLLLVQEVAAAPVMVLWVTAVQGGSSRLVCL